MGFASGEPEVRSAAESPPSRKCSIKTPAIIYDPYKKASPYILSGFSAARDFLRRSKSSIISRTEKLPPLRWFRRTFPGWQAGVVTAIAMATLALILNIAFLAWAAQHHGRGSNGLGTLFEGDCDKIGTWNKVGHGIINILSTGLLGLSNYCMQLLASPTRKSVDSAHEKREWVDIGIQSFRNIWKRHISPKRSACWLLLAISSAPLHLLWNSVIIFSPSAFSYNSIQVTEGFPHGLSFNDDVYIDLSSTEAGAHWPDNLHLLQQDLSKYERLSNIDCKRAYAQNFIQNRGDVVVVLKPILPDTNTSTVLGAVAGGWGQWPYYWLCPPETSKNFKCYNQLFDNGDSWTFPKYDDIGNDVQYCLSKRMEERCKLEYGFNITIIVILANTVKVACCVATYFIMKQHTSSTISGDEQHENTLLITTGDAIASFLAKPDKETVGMSIVEKEDFQNGIWDLRWVAINSIPWRRRSRCSTFRAIGKLRWVFGNILLSLIPIVPGFYLLNQIHWFRKDLQLGKTALFQQGIGNPNALFLFGTWSTGDSITSSGVLRNVALANIPQLAISVAYFFWNGHLTTMLAAREYDRFAAPDDNREAAKHSLRVTNPGEDVTEQKSTHFLTVPLKYWAANTVIWTALHYFASQAVFFARVDILDHWLEPTQWSINQVGYSVLGLVCFVAISLVALTFGVGIGLMRLQNRMPLAATCSGALSAACHPHDPKAGHHKKKVHWGVEIIDGADLTDGNGDSSKVAHCTFTSGEARYPDTGIWYA